MALSWCSVSRKRESMVGGKSGAGMPVSMCTIGAMVRRIWEILRASSGLRFAMDISRVRRRCRMVEIGRFALLMPLVVLMRWVCICLGGKGEGLL